MFLTDSKSLYDIILSIYCGRSGMSPKNKTVLIVEDNELNMKLFHDLLEMNGYGTLCAKDGMEGWQAAQDNRPDLILMDIQLPGVSGLEVTKWIKADENLKSIPVIALTAFAMKGDEDKILQGGCNAYMGKPIRALEFLETVERVISVCDDNSADHELKTA